MERLGASTKISDDLFDNVTPEFQRFWQAHNSYPLKSCGDPSEIGQSEATSPEGDVENSLGSEQSSSQEQAYLRQMEANLREMSAQVFPERMLLLQDVLFKGLTEESEDRLWSIHTTDVQYCGDKGIAGNLAYQPVPLNNTQILDTGTSMPVYPGVTASVTDEYNPDMTVGATVLQASDRKVIIPLTYGSMAQARLKGINQQLNVLVDTGASKCIVSEKLVNKWLKTNPKYQLTDRQMQFGNGKTANLHTMVKLVLVFEPGVEIEVVAYVLEDMPENECVIGMKAMAELEAQIKVNKLTLSFQNRSSPIKLKKRIRLLPMQEETVEVCIDESDTTGKIVSKLWSDRPDFVPYTMPVSFHKGVAKLKLCNMHEVPKEWYSNQVLGTADLRSIGLYEVEADTLERRHRTKVSFKTEKETADFFKKSVDQWKAQVSKEFTATKEDPYPWLPDDDPRKQMTDEEIIRQFVNLDHSILNSEEKEELYQELIGYRDVFSLRDEIGVCPDLTVELEVHDKTPFRVRPYKCKEETKAYIDEQMLKGCKLGILKPGLSPWNSPVMLIPRKIGPPRIVTDFRYLNARLVKLNPSIPLVRDAIQQLGASECDCLSVIDLKDAFHTLRLALQSQKYCGIVPYEGSQPYVYQRLAMGLSVSPAVWQNFITTVMNELPNRKHHLAIMDDCLIHSKKSDHLEEVRALFDALRRHGLKVSPKKCQLFRDELTYMGHTFLIRNGRPAIKAHKNRIEAIQKINQMKSPKDCKSFCGAVNFLSMYLDKLQTILIPIYKLTRKSVPFEWTRECQDAFEEVKRLVTQAPVLGMPDCTGLYQLYSDTSKIGCGASLFQIQNGNPILLGYHSKKLHEACMNYSITELEFTGLVINIAAFKTLLLYVDFEVYVDHSALVHIHKAKTEPKTTRIQRLLEIASLYSFVVKYKQGKDMLIADFLSRHPDNDMSDPTDVIPISFPYNDTFRRVMTRSQTKKQAEQDAVRPEKVTNPIADVQVDVPVQGILPSKGDVPQNLGHGPLEYQVADTEDEFVSQILHNRRGKTRKTDPIPDWEAVCNPLPVTITLSGQYPDAPVDPDELGSVIITDQDKGKLLPLVKDQKIHILRPNMPKQTEFVQLVRKLAHSAIKSYELPITASEIAVAYAKSPYFKDKYRYLLTGEVPTTFNTDARKRFKSACWDLVLVNKLVFMLTWDNLGEENLVLCIPEKYASTILYQYHDTAIAAHHGIEKTYLTMRQKYFIPNMHAYITKYVKTCQICQEAQSYDSFPTINEIRVPGKFHPMMRMSMDLKDMCWSTMGYKHLLICTCEITNWVCGIPLASATTEVIFEAIYSRIICTFGTPQVIISDQGSALTSTMMKELYDMLQIKPLYVGVRNHGSLVSERYIQSATKRLCRVLQGEGSDWPYHVAPCIYAMNTFVSPNTGFSPYEMVFIRKPPSISELEKKIEYALASKVETPEYMKLMKAKLKRMQILVSETKLVQQQTRKIREQFRVEDKHPIQVGDLVMILRPNRGSLRTNRKNIARPWVGPAVVVAMPSANKFMVSDFSGQMIPVLLGRAEVKLYNARILDKGTSALKATSEVLDVLNELRATSTEPAVT